MARVVKHLTDADRELIKQRYVAGVLVELIVQEVGFSRFTVQKTVKLMGLNRYTPRPQHHVNPDLFSVLGPEERYWLGFLITDGSISKHRVKFCLAKEDKDGVEAFCAFVNNGGSVTEHANECTFRFTSMPVANRLKELGVVERKTKCATAPDIVLDDYDFWRGVIDGDGGVDIQTTLPLISLTGHKDSQLLRQFSFFVSRNLSGPPPAVNPRREQPSVCDVRIAGFRAAHLTRLLYDRSGPVLASTKTGAEKIFAWKPKKLSVCRKL